MVRSDDLYRIRNTVVVTHSHKPEASIKQYFRSRRCVYSETLSHKNPSSRQLTTSLHRGPSRCSMKKNTAARCTNYVATVSTSVEAVDRRENQYLTDTEMFDGCEIINPNNKTIISTARILGVTESGLKMHRALPLCMYVNAYILYTTYMYVVHTGFYDIYTYIYTYINR